jgi:hypothetical protein
MSAYHRAEDAADNAAKQRVHDVLRLLEWLITSALCRVHTRDRDDRARASTESKTDRRPKPSVTTGSAREH